MYSKNMKGNLMKMESERNTVYRTNMNKGQKAQQIQANNFNPMNISISDMSDITRHKENNLKQIKYPSIDLSAHTVLHKGSFVSSINAQSNNQIFYNANIEKQAQRPYEPRLKINYAKQNNQRYDYEHVQNDNEQSSYFQNEQNAQIVNPCKLRNAGTLTTKKARQVDKSLSDVESEYTDEISMPDNSEKKIMFNKFKKMGKTPSAQNENRTPERSEFDNFGEYDSEMNRDEEDYDYGDEDQEEQDNVDDLQSYSKYQKFQDNVISSVSHNYKSDVQEAEKGNRKFQTHKIHNIGHINSIHNIKIVTPKTQTQMDSVKAEKSQSKYIFEKLVKRGRQNKIINSYIQYHSQKYMEAKKKLDDSLKNYDEVADVEQILLAKRIRGFKYNYSVDEEVQEFGSSHMYLQLDEGGKHLTIMNMRFVDRTEYTLEPDPQKIDELRKKRYYQLKLIEQEKLRPIYTNKKMDRDPDFRHQQSSCSCDISQIKGIHFGGTNARFWMLRKHFNSMSKNDLQYVPFYSWQCLTLQLYHRDVDLVITDEKEMEYLLMYLIFKIRATNGQRGSADKILDFLNSQDIEQYKVQNNKKYIPENQKIQIIQKNEHLLFKKVFRKYIVMKVRAKISFIAFEKRLTLTELFCQTIDLTYRQLIAKNEIQKPSLEQEKLNEEVLKMLNISQFSGIISSLVDYNKNKHQDDPHFKPIIQKLNRLMEEKNKHKENNEEIIKVKLKTGEEKSKLINYEENEKKYAELVSMTNKGTCIDLFRFLPNFITQNQNPDEPEVPKIVSNKQFIKLKLKRFSRQIVVQKISFAISLKALKGVTMIKAILRKYQLRRELFIFDIEEGGQVFIPYELSQDQFPLSMRYYDPLIAIVQENVNEDQRDLFDLKNRIAFAIHRHVDLKQQILEKLGIIDNGKQGKLSFSYSAVNKKSPFEINHNQSCHTNGLQRSKYLCVDDNLSKYNILVNLASKMISQSKQKSVNRALEKDFFHIRDHVNESDTEGQKKKKENLIYEILQKDELILRYCLTKEVQEKRSQMLNAKAQFLLRSTHLKSLGQKNKTIELLDNWVEKNLDILFQDPYIREVVEKNSIKEKLTPHFMMNMKNEEFRKNRFKTQVVTYMEQLTKDRRIQIRTQKLNDILYFNNVKIDFQERVKYIDSNVEESIKFFISKAGNEQKIRENNKIRADVKKIMMRSMKNKQQNEQD